ncbi:protein of unknown function (plasmid) [Rhodovastum atsumiense]|nr:protein of unknown function [Rhodovastum atsumiense]
MPNRPRSPSGSRLHEVLAMSDPEQVRQALTGRDLIAALRHRAMEHHMGMEVAGAIGDLAEREQHRLDAMLLIRAVEELEAGL